MRLIRIYFVWDNISEMVLTAFTAVNDKIARKSFSAMVEKSQLDKDDVQLYMCAGCSVPDNFADLTDLLADGDVVLLEV